MTLQLLLGSLLKAENLHIVLAAVGPFEGRVHNYDVHQKILNERLVSFSPNIKKIYARNNSRGVPNKGRPRQTPSSLPLKHMLALRSKGFNAQ